MTKVRFCVNRHSHRTSITLIGTRNELPDLERRFSWQTFAKAMLISAVVLGLPYLRSQLAAQRMRRYFRFRGNTRFDLVP